MLSPERARLNDKCDLALVLDADLKRRLRNAYRVSPANQVTGWRLEPASGARAPAEDEPEVAWFLGNTPTLVKYDGTRASR